MVGESNVVLTEDVIKKDPREFIKSWVEWASDNEELILKSRNRIASGDTTLYTVPENKTLYITNAYCSISCNSGAPSFRKVIIFIDSLNGENAQIITSYIYGGGTNNTNQLSYSMPIKVESGSIIVLDTGSNSSVSGGFVGFLVAKKVS